MTFTLQPVTSNMAAAGIARGGNPMGLPQFDHQCEHHYISDRNLMYCG